MTPFIGGAAMRLKSLEGASRGVGHFPESRGRDFQSGMLWVPLDGESRLVALDRLQLERKTADRWGRDASPDRECP